MLNKKLGYFLVLMMALFLAACSDSGPSEQTSAPPSPSPEEANGEENQGETANGEPIKIGLLVPYSGVYASLGENLTKGMELYFDEVGWTVEGRPIEIIAEDTESDPQVSLRLFRKLVDQDQIHILSGPVSTAVAYALRDEVDSRGIPFLVSHAGGNDLTRSQRSDYIWRSSFSSWQIGYSLGEWAYHNVADEVMVVSADYAFGHEVSSAFMEAFREAGGKIVSEVYPPLGNNDYAPYLTEINNVKPKAVYSFFAGSDAVRYVQQYEQYGLKGKIPLIGAGWLTAEDVRPSQGLAPEGIIASIFWDYSLDTPENKDFIQKYEQKYNERPSIESLEGYDAARVIVEALKSIGGDTSDSKKIVEAISQVEFTSPRGPFRFDQQTHHVIQNMYVVETYVDGDKTENRVIDTIPEVVDPGQ